MPVRSKFKRPTRATKKKHISEISVSQKTVLRYRSGIQLFYKWRKSEGLAPSSSFSELDVQLGEYINFLYQNDMPLYRGGDVLSGFKKFYPRGRRLLEISTAWYYSWVKISKRTQAMPLHPDVAKAFISYNLLKKEKEFALSLLVGFLCLLRGGEILSLNLCDCQFREANYMKLILRDTKGAKLKKIPFETVILRDPLAIQSIMYQKSMGVARLFNGTPGRFYALYREAVQYFHLRHERPTPHGIRRGGASWHFNLKGSFDATIEHGRWSSVKSARIYINEAAAEDTIHLLSPLGKQRVKDGVSIYRKLLCKAFA